MGTSGRRRTDALAAAPTRACADARPRPPPPPAAGLRRGASSAWGAAGPGRSRRRQRWLAASLEVDSSHRGVTLALSAAARPRVSPRGRAVRDPGVVVTASPQDQGNEGFRKSSSSELLIGREAAVFSPRYTVVPHLESEGALGLGECRQLADLNAGDVRTWLPAPAP